MEVNGLKLDGNHSLLAHFDELVRAGRLSMKLLQRLSSENELTLSPEETQSITVVRGVLENLHQHLWPLITSHLSSTQQ